MSVEHERGLLPILTVGFFAVGALYFFAVNCGGARDEDVVSAAESSGMRNVRVTGYAAFNCGEHDVVHREVKGISESGRRVRAAVCCGLLKACTVRWLP